MKKILFLLIAAMISLSSSATKIYVCGTQITGTTSFSAAGGTVSYYESSRTLTITNVDYRKSGSSNNGISVDEVSGPLTIILNGNVQFYIQDADAVLTKCIGITTTIKVNGTAYFYTYSSSHAGLKLQESHVNLEGPGSLVIKNCSSSSSANAVKGGVGTEKLKFQIKDCIIESNGPRLNKLRLDFCSTEYYGTGNYSNMSSMIRLYPGNSNTVHALNYSIGDIYSGMRVFLPIDYFDQNLLGIGSSSYVGNELVISDYKPAVVIIPSYVPDANLRSYLRTLIPQGYLTTSVMQTYTSLDVSNKNISSLQGLGQFANLKELVCNHNNLTQLPTDLPASLETLDCSYNQIQYLTSALTQISLKTLNCSNNKLTVMAYYYLPTSIENLDCSYNNIGYLWKIDYNYNSLKKLYCNNNQITDVYTLPNNLEIFNCSNNKLTEININDRHHLISFNCSYNNLSNLYVVGCSSLDYLNCAVNNLTSLSVQGCNALSTLNCSDNKIKGTEMASLISSLRTIPKYINSYYNPPGNLYVIGEADQQANSDGNAISQLQVVNANKKHWDAFRLSLPRYRWVQISFSSPLGDVNGDGHVSSVDVTALYNYLLNNDSSDIVNGDQDGDGHISSVDVTVVYDILQGNN